MIRNKLVVSNQSSSNEYKTRSGTWGLHLKAIGGATDSPSLRHTHGLSWWDTRVDGVVKYIDDGFRNGRKLHRNVPTFTAST